MSLKTPMDRPTQSANDFQVPIKSRQIIHNTKPTTKTTQESYAVKTLFTNQTVHMT